MRQLRRTWILLFLALLIPSILLVDQTLNTLDSENERRHRLLAERVFDEMERALTQLLREEEAKPYDVYRFLHQPQGQAQVEGTLQLSPLAKEPTFPFIITYFQVDPDTSHSSPSIPQADELALYGQPWSPPANQAVIVDELNRWVSGAFVAQPNPQNWENRPEMQAPGTTLALSEFSKQSKKDERNFQAALQPKNRDSYRSKLGTLNRGSSGRNSLLTKVGSPYQQTQNFTKGPPPQNNPRQQNKEIEVQLEPMVSRLASPERLLLYRTVIIGEKGYRQGLLIDTHKLIDYLQKTSIGNSRIGQFSGGSWATFDTDSPPDGPHLYRHRFAAPFSELGGILNIVPLPPSDSQNWVKGLALALLLGTTFGLFSLYRAVSIQVSFAKRRSDFVSAVSHELKTPITSIRMYAEMLQENMVSGEDKKHRYYAIITSEAERLSRLVGNVLELSRIEEGNRKMTLTVGQLEPTIQDIHRALLPHSKTENFTLDVSIEKAIPDVYFEDDALRQILFNLVDNAFKYSKSNREHRVVLALECKNKQVAVTVRDFGPGVPPKYIQKIFEPFFRGERELTRETKGTGIGLALVKGLAEGMSARVEARNHPEGGLEMRILLKTAPSVPSQNT